MDQSPLDLLADHRVLTTPQLVVASGSPERTVDYRLSRLFDAGLVVRTRPYKDVGHPTVYLSEAKLNPAVLDFLATAVFGPEREAYWRYCLKTAQQPESASPNDDRVQELETEISDLETRLERQILSLEAEESALAFRRRIAQRIGGLDQAMVEKRRLRDQLASHAAAPAPRFADIAGLLSKLPLIAERLHELPMAELRRLFEALQLTVTYHHDKKEVDIEITLHNGGLDGAQVCSCPRSEPGQT